MATFGITKNVLTYYLNQTQSLPMSKSMLDYTKSVLKRVSFDVDLFCKELQKACRVLLPFEIEELTSWLSKFTEEKPELRHAMLLIK